MNDAVLSTVGVVLSGLGVVVLLFTVAWVVWARTPVRVIDDHGRAGGSLPRRTRDNVQTTGVMGLSTGVVMVVMGAVAMWVIPALVHTMR